MKQFVANWRDARRGFSLLELLVAVAILALVMVPIAFFYSRALQAVEAASIRNRALELAQERINEIKGMPYEMLRANNQPSSDDIVIAVTQGGYAQDTDFADHTSFMWSYPLPLGFNPYQPATQGYYAGEDVPRNNGNLLGGPAAPHINMVGEGGTLPYEYEPIGFYTGLRRTNDFRTTDPRTQPLFERPSAGLVTGAGDYQRVGTEYRRDLYSIYGRRTIILDVVPEPADDDNDVYPVDSPYDGGANPLDPYPPTKGPRNKFQVRSKYGIRGKLVTVQVFWLPRVWKGRVAKDPWNHPDWEWLPKEDLNVVELKTFIPANNAENAVDVESDLLTSNNLLFISSPPS